MNDYLIGHIRTWVPILVGVAVTWLARELGIVIDEATETNLVIGIVGAVSAVYYALIRGLAEKWPWIGTLLGVNKAPVYSQPPVEEQ